MLKKSRILKSLVLFFSISCANITNATINEIEIVVTIKPIHGLVSAVVKDVLTPPKLLVPATQSPHNYSLTPKNMQLLSKAKIIFWSGTDLEAFMYNALNHKKIQAKSINFAAVKGLTLIPRKGLKDHCPNCVDKKAAHMQDLDPHYWLDPHNAIVLIDAIAKSMAEIDPKNVAAYSSNALKTKTKLIQLNKELSARFKTVKDVPFLVLHDAYQYLQNRYNLSYLGALTVNPNLGLSAKRLQKINKVIEQHRPVCIFREPQINAKAINSILAQAPYKIHTSIIDPIGVNTNLDATGYFNLMQDIAKNIQSCLIKHNDDVTRN